MALGTAPDRLVTLFENTWQAQRAGRGDVPPMYDTTKDIDLQKNVVVPLRNREESGVDRGIHDIIHSYHPEANPPDIQDNGYKEVRETETVQVDIDLTDRSIHSNPVGDTRSSARERMKGDRADLADTGEPPYPGIQGEVMYVLETVRRGLDEWDTVRFTLVNQYLGNSNATVSFSVELVQLARNTVQ